MNEKMKILLITFAIIGLVVSAFIFYPQMMNIYLGPTL